MDTYRVSSVNPWWGLTQMYVDTTQVDPFAQNWWWAKILLDGEFANCPNKKGVIGHEMGHVFGLAHVSTSTSLMYTGIGSTNVTRATKDDNDGINFLY